MSKTETTYSYTFDVDRKRQQYLGDRLSYGDKTEWIRKNVGFPV